MLPRDLLRIVDGYNEHDKGFFFVSSNLVYWFNGKRYEIWCHTNISINLVYDRSINLVYDDGYLKVQDTIYKNLKWQPLIFNAQKSNVRINSVDYTLEYLHVGKFILLDKKLIELKVPDKNYDDFGVFVMVYESILYFFSSTKNEKYDFTLNKWSDFTNPVLKGSIGQCYSLNDLFYIIEDITYNIHIYDPKLDKWSFETLHAK